MKSKTERAKGIYWAEPDGYTGIFKILWQVWRGWRGTILWVATLVPLFYHLTIFLDYITKPYRVWKYYKDGGLGNERAKLKGR